MYKNKKRKINKSKKVLAALLIALLVLGAFVYIKFVRDDPASLSQEEQKAAEQADVDQAKQKAEEESQSEPLKENDEDDTTPATTPNSVSLSTPSFSQTNHMINSSVQVSGVSTGSCKFTFVDADGKPVVKSTALSGGTCSVAISEAEFTLLGTWKLTVEFGSKSVSRDVNIS